MLKRDTTTYFSDAQGLNSFGYQLFYENQEQKAIEIFTFATEEFPENANLFDSLGEVYFNNEDYENALDNYKKSLELNPDNENAQAYIEKIKQLSL
jgi:tetratricopeptide (TPR) repeat protein